MNKNVKMNARMCACVSTCVGAISSDSLESAQLFVLGLRRVIDLTFAGGGNGSDEVVIVVDGLRRLWLECLRACGGGNQS